MKRETEMETSIALVCALMAAVAVGAGSEIVREGARAVPFIYCSDIFHPAMDPDDHFDLAALFAMKEFDVKAVILDGHIDRKGQGQFNGGGRIPLAQMSAISGYTLPSAVGLNVKLADPLDKLENGDPRYLAGVELMKKVLVESPIPVTIKISTGTDLAVLFNREPELCRRKIRAVYFNAGHGKGGVTDEYNALLDPVAFTRIFETGLPLFWNPCFGEGRAVGDGHCNFFKIPDQRVLLEKAPAALSKFFSYALLRPESDPIAWLEIGNAAVVPKQERWMWTPPVLAHAAGRRVFRVNEKDFAWLTPSAAKAGTEEHVVYSYVPAKVTVVETRRSNAVLDVQYGAPDANVRVFRQTSPDYAAVMTACLRNLYGEIGKK